MLPSDDCFRFLAQRTMVPGTHVLIEIVLRTAVVYVVVLLGVRLSGKREVGQMTPFDLTLLLLISNSVQNAMTGPGQFTRGRYRSCRDAPADELRRRRRFRNKPAFPQADCRANRPC